MNDLFIRYEFVIYAAVILAMLGMSTQLTLSVGSLSVAAPAFMALGAYTGALASRNWDIPFVIIVLLGAIIAAFGAGLTAIPALRLGHLYLALLTLAVVYMVQLGASLLDFTGGASGLTGIPYKSSRAWIFGVFAVTCVFFARLQRTRAGYYIQAVGESERSAEALGLSPTRVRLVVYMTSGAIAGVAGVLSVHLDQFVTPETYGFPLIISILTAVYLGGARVWYGAIVGAAVVMALPEVLRPLADNRDYVYGGLLLATLVYAPEGLAGVLGKAGRAVRQRVVSRLGTIRMRERARLEARPRLEPEGER